MVTEPENMDDLVYFTRRALGDKGHIMCWVYRKECPECGKALMGKPKKADGGVKIRSPEYECPECGHKVEKAEYEATLTAEAKYTCPECSNEGEGEAPFKWKTIEGAKTVRFQCSKCEANLDVTKKMKDKKKKKPK